MSNVTTPKQARMSHISTLQGYIEYHVNPRIKTGNRTITVNPGYYTLVLRALERAGWIVKGDEEHCSIMFHGPDEVKPLYWDLDKN